MRPSASRVRRVADNTREEMSGILRPSSLNRMGPFSLRTSMTRSAHLLPKRATTFRTGHISIIEFNCSFFLIYSFFLKGHPP